MSDLASKSQRGRAILRSCRRHTTAMTDNLQSVTDVLLYMLYHTTATCMLHCYCSACFRACLLSPCVCALLPGAV
eukprot:scaffold7320_cov139-Isochrysis_galbana.AAC.1